MTGLNLPRIHSDPADRLFIATAQHYNLALLTPDKPIAKYPNVNLIW